MLYVNNVYTMCLPSFGGDNVYGSISPSACSDEIGGDLNSLMEGSIGFGQVGAFSASTYAAVRYINIAFEELESSTMSEAEFNRVAGQLYFFVLGSIGNDADAWWSALYEKSSGIYQRR